MKERKKNCIDIWNLILSKLDSISYSWISDRFFFFGCGRHRCCSSISVCFLLFVIITDKERNKMKVKKKNEEESTMELDAIQSIYIKKNHMERNWNPIDCWLLSVPTRKNNNNFSCFFVILYMCVYFFFYLHLFIGSVFVLCVLIIRMVHTSLVWIRFPSRVNIIPFDREREKKKRRIIIGENTISRALSLPKYCVLTKENET